MSTTFKLSGRVAIVTDMKTDDLVRMFGAISHLIIEEEATRKHWHFLVVTDASPEAWRLKIRRAYPDLGRGDLSVKRADSGNGSWQKAKQYLCKEENLKVISSYGPEFSAENLTLYHENYNDHGAKLRRDSRGKMDILRDEVTETDLQEICCHVARIYKERHWLMNKTVMVNQVRTLHCRSEEGEQSFVNDLVQSFNYSDLRR